jgi:hypothetical protein
MRAARRGLVLVGLFVRVVGTFSTGCRLFECMLSTHVIIGDNFNVRNAANAEHKHRQQACSILASLAVEQDGLLVPQCSKKYLQSQLCVGRCT